jgi:hypothetical protein
MESYEFVCEDFPKENQKLANKAADIDLGKTSNFLYTVLPIVIFRFAFHGLLFSVL